MEQIWVAALSINLALLLCFLCCVRLFNCCMRYSTIVRDFYQGGLTKYEEFDESSSQSHSTINDGSTQYSRRSVQKRITYVNEALLAESRRLWLPRTPAAVIAVLCLIVDSCALASFSFSANSPMNKNTESLTWAEWLVFLMHRTSRLVMLDNPSIPYPIVFYCCCSAAFLTVPLAIYILAKDKRDNDPSQIVFQMLGNLALFPICCTLFSILSCKYTTGAPPIFERWNPEDPLICWSNSHTRLVALSLCAFTCYYVVCTIVMARLVRSVLDEAQLVAREGPSALYFRPRFVVWYFQLRICASFLATYWGGGQYPAGIVAGGVAAATAAMLTYTVYNRPCNADVHNALRIYALTLPLFIDISAILSLLLPSWSSVGQWLMLAFGSLWLLGVLTHYVFEFGCTCCFAPRDHDYTGFADLSAPNSHRYMHSHLNSPLASNRMLTRASEPLPGAYTNGQILPGNGNFPGQTFRTGHFRSSSGSGNGIPGGGEYGHEVLPGAVSHDSNGYNHYTNNNNTSNSTGDGGNGSGRARGSVSYSSKRGQKYTGGTNGYATPLIGNNNSEYYGNYASFSGIQNSGNLNIDTSMGMGISTSRSRGERGSISVNSGTGTAIGDYEESEKRIKTPKSKQHKERYINGGDSTGSGSGSGENGKHMHDKEPGIGTRARGKSMLLNSGLSKFRSKENGKGDGGREGEMKRDRGNSIAKRENDRWENNNSRKNPGNAKNSELEAMELNHVGMNKVESPAVKSNVGTSTSAGRSASVIPVPHTLDLPSLSEFSVTPHFTPQQHAHTVYKQYHTSNNGTGVGMGDGVEAADTHFVDVNTGNNRTSEIDQISGKPVLEGRQSEHQLQSHDSFISVAPLEYLESSPSGMSLLTRDDSFVTPPHSPSILAETTHILENMPLPIASSVPIDHLRVLTDVHNRNSMHYYVEISESGGEQAGKVRKNPSNGQENIKFARAGDKTVKYRDLG